MMRLVSGFLLIAFILAASLAQAQRAGIGTFGRGVGSVGITGGIRGHRGPRNGIFPGHFHSRRFESFGPLFPLFWYDEPFGYDEPYPAAVPAAPSPVIVLQNDKQQPPAPDLASVSPKLIEVPGVVASAVSKPQAGAIFILTNGERLEAQRYMLTADNLRITVDRQQRVIPLAMLDLNATLAANRERGIELRVPSDRNEISLGF